MLEGAMATMIRALGLLAVTLAAAAGSAACAPSLPPGTRVCVGFPAEVCQRQVADLVQEGMTHGGVAAYRIVCTSGSCTAAQGTGTATVVFADGTGRQGGFGYAAAVGTPPPEPSRGLLPVAPACIGVPDGWCREEARTSAEHVADWSSIVAITVHCTSTCTTTKGDGETRVRVVDGSEQATGWNYNGEVPPDPP
jgi:hypothetical protein